MSVKPEEFVAMCRLEAALDLGAEPAKVVELSERAARSLGGAADVAALAWLDGAGVTPDWAATLGVKWPAVAWVQGRGRGWVEPVPEREGRQPGSRFLVFQDRVRGDLVRAGVPRQSTYKILGAFAEVADNATEHSESPTPPLATFEVGSAGWQFSVTDFGMGVPNSLRTNPAYSTLGDLESVQEALKDGVSRFPSSERGFGFGDLFRALAEMRCSVRLRTGSVAVHWSGHGEGLTDLVYDLVAPRAGLHVRVMGSP